MEQYWNINVLQCFLDSSGFRHVRQSRLSVHPSVPPSVSPFVRSFTTWLAGLLVRSFALPSVRSFAHPLVSWLVGFFVRSFVLSFMLPPLYTLACTSSYLHIHV